MNVKRLTSEELYHYGIKGQRRGVRRFQNADGTLTAAGKKRYYVEGNSPNKPLSRTSNITVNHFNPDGTSYHNNSDGTTTTHTHGGATVTTGGGTHNTSDYGGASFTSKEEAKRREFYKKEAFNSTMKAKAHEREKKELVYHMKLFGKSFKEVHSENINKGKSKVQSILAKLKR